MIKNVARILGVVVALLAVVGFFVEGEHLLEFMNVDIAIDILRTVLAVALLAVGFSSASFTATRAVVAIVGVLYIGMGALGLADRTLFGMLPTGLTDFDLGFHLVVGVLALALAIFARERAGERRTVAAAR